MGIIKKKGKYSNPVPPYSPSDEEQEWYRYCVRNDIRISLKPVKEEIGVWHITVVIGPYKRGEKINVSPSVYTRDNVHQMYYQTCKYYYDKRKK